MAMLRFSLHPVVRCLRPGSLAALALCLAWGSVPSASAEESFQDLLANLKSPTARTRQEAVTELGKSRRREAVAPISALVRDPELKVRLAVVTALRSLRDLSGIPALVTSLQDGDPGIREESIGTIVEIYAERDRSGAVGAFLQTFSDEYDRSSVPPFTSVDPAVFRGLAAALKDEKKDIRAESAYAIGILGGGSAVPDLVPALQDPESDVRAAAATALGKVGTADDGKALIPLLADDSTTVRNRALQAIGVLRVRDAGPALREMFEQNRRRELGTRVLASLSRIGDPAQGDLFRELLYSNDPEHRRLAVEGLGRVADTSMLPSFKKDYQREKSSSVRLAYNFAIVLLGDHAFIDAIALELGSSGASAKQAQGYVMELGPPMAPDLYPYLNDPSAGVRGGTCDILAQFGDVAAIPRLTPLLADPDSKVAGRTARSRSCDGPEARRRRLGDTGAAARDRGRRAAPGFGTRLPSGRARGRRGRSPGRAASARARGALRRRDRPPRFGRRPRVPLPARPRLARQGGVGSGAYPGSRLGPSRGGGPQAGRGEGAGLSRARHGLSPRPRRGAPRDRPAPRATRARGRGSAGERRARPERRSRAPELC
jgi:HEAT repeat protein